MRRRDALVIGASVAAAVALPPLLRRLPSAFDFEPLPGFDGFRRLAGGAVSGGANPFVGLGERPPAPADADPSEPVSPCLALFGSETWTSESLPVVVFSDFNCAYCKALEDELIELESSGAPISLIWHELPMLGAGSYRSARAVLAARFLGAEKAARTYVWQRKLRPGPVGLARMAEALNISPEVFQREVGSPRVTIALQQSLSLGARLGIPGTPGTVIGRTLVIGSIKQSDVLQLIALERDAGPLPCA
jgi:hypothetical protein